jgi:hypothetical protein
MFTEVTAWLNIVTKLFGSTAVFMIHVVYTCAVHISVEFERASGAVVARPTPMRKVRGSRPGSGTRIFEFV